MSNKLIEQSKLKIQSSSTEKHARESEITTSKSITLKDGQRLDLFWEVKLTVYAIDEKDWHLYPKMCKNMIFFILQGPLPKDCTRYGCNIKFFDKKEFIDMLRKNVEHENKTQIELLIQEIHAIDQGVYYEDQTSLPEYLEDLML